MTTPTVCEHCGQKLIGKRRDARYCDSTCRADATRVRQELSGASQETLRSAAREPAHPLAAARAEQEASKLNRDLGAVVQAAIIRRLSEPPYRVHADDLEGDYPAEHVERCRSLAPAQFGGLAGAGHIREVERRKSSVPSRKGAKSSVYEFTISGRQKLAGSSAVLSTPSSKPAADTGDDVRPLGSSVGPGQSPSVVLGAEGDARLFEPEPERPLSAFTDAEAA